MRNGKNPKSRYQRLLNDLGEAPHVKVECRYRHSGNEAYGFQVRFREEAGDAGSVA
jgi:hypothetical protein